MEERKKERRGGRRNGRRNRWKEGKEGGGMEGRKHI